VQSDLHQRLKRLSYRLNFAVSSELRSRFTRPDNLVPLEKYLRESYLPSHHAGANMSFLETDWGRRELAHYLTERLEDDRHEFIPWLNRFVPLQDAQILQVGCGTGCFAIALAEQGVRVTAIDVHDEAIEATRIRCALHGLEDRIRPLNGNAANLESVVGSEHYDVVAFVAVLGNMTASERRASLRAAWSRLSPGGFLAVLDEPNRLWPFDSQTSQLPFFHWLPDELAFEYSNRSPRVPFNTQFREQTPEKQLRFVREGGRGISYHDIELAIGEHRVVTGQDSFIALRSPLKLAKRVLARDLTRERWLNSFSPDRPRAYFRSYLNMLIAAPVADMV
jgi:2-polyprenyl-3-methyl-5-hydroxy-6-metoxy-1,4-benzoquinol methylase